jgi:hypothetical protein
MPPRNLLQRGPYSAIIPDSVVPSDVPYSGGQPDDLLPWNIGIDVMMTPIAQSNFQLGSTSSSYVYNAYCVVVAQSGYAEYDVVLARGTWTIEIVHQKQFGNGIYTLQLNGATVGTIDSYSASTVDNARAQITGVVVDYTSKYRLRITNPTKNASASNYFLRYHHIQFKRTA